MQRILLFLSVTASIAVSAQTKPIPRDTTYNVPTVYRQIHKDFPQAVPAIDSVPDGVTAQRNIVYTTLPSTPFGTRQLHLDVFAPAKPGKYPTLIMIHGGGWRSGTKAMQIPMAELLAARGFVCIPLEYQLSLEAKYPAAMHNIKSAIRYVRAHADQFQVDTSAIAISGCSAGGHLAMLTGMTNHVDLFEGSEGNAGWSSEVKAVINIDGVVDFLAPGSLNLQRKQNSPDVEWLGGSYEQKPNIWKEASPIFWASQATAIPVCFINGGFSRFHAGREEFIMMMQEWNKRTEVHTFNIKMHPFWLFHPWVDTTVGYMANFLKWTFGNASRSARRLTVAKDGSGDFTTVQGALDAVRVGAEDTTEIFIKKGVYKEKLWLAGTRKNVHLIGEDRDGTIITFDDFAARINQQTGRNIGTRGSATFTIDGDGFSAENLTFENNAGMVGQAVAVAVNADRVKFVNCRFLGCQDTLYTVSDGREYFKGCWIEGTVDYIFGAATAVFEECRIFSKVGGYVTAASTPAGAKYGYVFLHCQVLGDAAVHSVLLGRPWRPYAKTVFIACGLGEVIRGEGWSDWDRKDNERTTYYAEYGSTGSGADAAARVAWSHQLTNAEAAEYAVEKIFGGWKP